MQTWNLGAGDPLSLTLAADSRLSNTDATDDQIWELTLSGGEPPALALQTTYGLRAHWMRLFPRFVRGDTARVDPSTFHIPPRLTQFSPNYLALTYAPFEGLEVQAEYWAVESQVVAGRLKITNHSILPLAFRLEWAALLNPMDRQGGMVPVQVGPTSILEGDTAYLQPVVYLTGGPLPISSPYPALALELELYPGNSRQFTWAAAALRSKESSLEAARAATARPWEAEMARVELYHRSQAVQITTGNADWDAALAWSQSAALQLLVKAPLSLPHPGLAYSRRPDQGFSARGDGSDQSHLWNGATPLDAVYLANTLPGAPETAAGLLRNFLTTQEESGKVELKPGLTGARSRRMAQPLLATLAVQIAPGLAQPDWYREMFAPLLRFFQAWFAPERDADGDGLPEWEHILQTGLEDSPIYDRWSPETCGLPVNVIESPALAAMLLRECQSLIEMARVLSDADKAGAAYARLTGAEAVSTGAEQALEELCALESQLRALLQETWNAEAKRYSYRDAHTHLWTAPESVFSFNGSGKMTLRKRFPAPRRLFLEIHMAESQTYAARVTLHGITPNGEVAETIEARDILWHGKQGRAATQNTYLAVRRVETNGLSENDQVIGQVADYTQEDCSLFLPLWAGAAEPEQAQQLIEETLLKRYAQPAGIPLCPPDRCLQEMLPGMHSARSSALLPWNALIGEGLLRYGYRDQAMLLVSGILNSTVDSLKTHRAFRQYYHAETGLAAGERGHLHGLAPVGFFLKTIGIQQISPKEIVVDGFNPFPATIHVQYRKVHITCFADHTEVTFAEGQTVTIDQTGPHRIRLS